LSVVNQCRNRHDFEVRLQNVPFLTVSQSRVRVNGQQTLAVPVQFSSKTTPPGVHRGQVVVVCQTCSREATCKQDREILDVVLTVTAPPSAPGAPPSNPPTPPPATPPANPGGVAGPAKPPVVAPTKPGTPRTTALFNEFGKGPCDCEELRKQAAAAEEAAAAAQAKADAARAEAEAAEQAARDAEAAAAKAEKAAQPAPSTYGATVDGQEYSSADVEYLERLRADNNAALKAGKITSAQHQARAKQLTAKLAREERLANEAKLKAEAAAARKAAEAARAAANAARARADAAQKDADKPNADAAAALDAYRKCLERCRLEAEARAAEEKQKKDDEARAAATRAEAERKKKADEDAARTRAAEQQYLLDNIRQLGLVSSAPFKDIPGAFDRVIDRIIPDSLGKTAEQWVAEMATMVAEETAGVQVPIGLIQAIGGLYQIAAALLDPCTAAGKLRSVQRLQGMINPKTKARYTLNEALDKTDKMCALLTELKSKIEAIRKLRGAHEPVQAIARRPAMASPIVDQNMIRTVRLGVVDSSTGWSGDFAATHRPGP
jgi:hypothetical protein